MALSPPWRVALVAISVFVVTGIMIFVPIGVIFEQWMHQQWPKSWASKKPTLADVLRIDQPRAVKEWDKWCNSSKYNDTRSPAELTDLWYKDQLPSSEEPTAVTVECAFTALDVTFYTATLQCSMGFWGEMDANPGLKAPRDNTTLVVVINGVATNFTPNQEASQVTVPLSLGDSLGQNQTNTEWYPRVKLPFRLEFRAAWVDKDTSAWMEAAPIALQLDFDFTPMYQVTGTFCDGRKSIGVNGRIVQFNWLRGYVEVNSVAKRVAVGGLSVCMWALAVSTLVASFWFVATADWTVAVPYDLLCFAAALLFALPAMRGLLPAAPPSGLWYDLVNIHIQLWLLTAAIVMQLLRAVWSVFISPQVPRTCTCTVHTPPERRRRPEAASASASAGRVLAGELLLLGW